MQVQSGPLGVSASLSFAPYVPDLPYPCPNPAVQFLQGKQEGDRGLRLAVGPQTNYSPSLGLC